MKKMILTLLVLGTIATTQAQDLDPRIRRDSDRPIVTRVLNKPDFEQLQRAIRKASFADDRKRVFQLGIQNSFVTVDQLEALLKQTSFDDEKLAWLTMAYPRTVDVQQYYRLRETLSFSGSKEQFDRSLLEMAKGERQRRPRVLDAAGFAQLKDLIRKESFADGRARVFRLGVQHNLITVSQLTEVIKLLSFDDEKLAVAKMAYPRTADIQRYYTLRDLFSFESSKRELDKFLIGNRS